jgi:hypothetical protein
MLQAAAGSEREAYFALRFFSGGAYASERLRRLLVPLVGSPSLRPLFGLKPAPRAPALFAPSSGVHSRVTMA